MSLSINEDNETPAKKVEEYLNEIDYSFTDGYVPSNFALEFIAFIKLVNGEDGEENKSPVIHYHMLDNVLGTEDVVNMCFPVTIDQTHIAQY